MAKKKSITLALPTAIDEGSDGKPLSSCRKCGSTQRGAMTETSRCLIDGKVHIWLRTQCAACGQMRIDRIVEDVARAKA